MKYNKILALLFLGFLFSCKKEKPIDNEIIKNYPKFHNFYFFKQGITTPEIIDLFNKNNIVHYKIDPNDTDRVIFLPFPSSITNVQDIINSGYKFEIIQGKSLKLLDKVIPEFEIGIVNDTLFYFIYQPYLEVDFKKENGLGFKNNLKIWEDLDLLKELSEALKEKYGYPTENNGNLNSFYPTSEKYYEYYNYNETIISYLEYSRWINNDSSMVIYLSNFNSLTEYNTNQTEHKNLIIQTNISVLFNRALLDSIVERTSKADSLKNIIEKRKSDSIDKIKIEKRKNQLKEL